MVAGLEAFDFIIKLDQTGFDLKAPPSSAVGEALLWASK